MVVEMLTPAGADVDHAMHVERDQACPFLPLDGIRRVRAAVGARSVGHRSSSACLLEEVGPAGRRRKCSAHGDQSIEVEAVGLELVLKGPRLNPRDDVNRLGRVVDLPRDERCLEPIQVRPGIDPRHHGNSPVAFGYAIAHHNTLDSSGQAALRGAPFQDSGR